MEVEGMFALSCDGGAFLITSLLRFVFSAFDAQVFQHLPANVAGIGEFARWMFITHSYFVSVNVKSVVCHKSLNI